MNVGDAGRWALGPGVAALLHRVLCSDLGSGCSPLPVLCPAVCAGGTGLCGVRGGALTNGDVGHEDDEPLDLEHKGPSPPQRFRCPGPDHAPGPQPDPQPDPSSAPKACVTLKWCPPAPSLGLPASTTEDSQSLQESHHTDYVCRLCVHESEATHPLPALGERHLYF